MASEKLKDVVAYTCHRCGGAGSAVYDRASGDAEVVRRVSLTKAYGEQHFKAHCLKCHRAMNEARRWRWLK